ncbi:MAG: hypothetical protein ACT4P5_08315 [Armatimonadota bacterium]
MTGETRGRTEGTDDEGSVWDHVDGLTDHELNALVAAAVSVISEGAEDPTALELAGLPLGPASREIQALLGEAGLEIDQVTAERIIREEGISRPLAISLLKEISNQPTLAAEIEAAYRQRQKLMIVDAGLVAAGALLLLVLKLKRVRVGKDAAEVEFYEAKGGALQAIRHFLGL